MRHDNNQMKGRIVDKFIQEFTRTIEWKEFHRTPSIDEPAYLFEQSDGSEFILSYNELQKSEHPDAHESDNAHVRMKDKKHTY